jgi:hypothetical protein
VNAKRTDEKMNAGWQQEPPMPPAGLHFFIWYLNDPSFRGIQVSPTQALMME